MQVKVRKENKDGLVRLQTSGKVKEILINEDFMHPNKESVSVCFRGEHSSGIIDLTPNEIEHLYKAVKSRTHLIKGMKTFKEKR